MEIQENRRLRLRQLIDDRFDRSQARFVEESGENQGEVSALLNGKKSFGEKKARKLESKVSLPTGWLDEPMAGDAASQDQTPAKIADQTIIELGSLGSNVTAVVLVDACELALLTAYRHASELGKSTITAAAEVADKPTALLRHQS